MRHQANPVRLEGDALVLGDLRVRFMRTLRLPTTDRTYPLPPGLGTFPLQRVADHADRVPTDWRRRGGVMLPIHEREAMWLSFSAAAPTALQVGVGKVCAVSGQRWTRRLRRRPQNYVVAPTQPWLDGINAGDGFVRQFLATQLGRGWTVEGQVTGEEVHGGVQLRAIGMREPERSTWIQEHRSSRGHHVMSAMAAPSPMAAPPARAPGAARSSGRAMGLGAGGRMRQKVYPDPHRPSVWEEAAAMRVFVHLVAAADWQALTGQPVPTLPPTAATYAKHGLPWFDLADDGASDLAAAPVLGEVAPLDELMNVLEDDVEVGPTITYPHVTDGSTAVVDDGVW